MKSKQPEMVPVPLPTEIPPPPNLENLPLDILHSATVEMLIQQNEDLSSRLKVNIRRNSQLEQRILKQEKEISELNRKRENVLAQIEIIKEKENIWKSQKQMKEKQAETLQKESDLLELRYQELYATALQKDKGRQVELVAKHKQVIALEQKLDILQRVRIRAKEKLRGLLIDMAQGLHKSHKYIERSESSNRQLKKGFVSLKTEILEKEDFFRGQLENLKQVSKQSLMSMDQQISDLKEKNRLMSEQKNEVAQELENLSLKLHEEKKNRNRVARLCEELAEVKNQRIRLKRDILDSNEKNQQLESDKLTEVHRLRQELHDIQESVKQNQESFSASEKKILELTRDNREISEQLASIQSLWMEAQEKLEKEELRSQTLEKINRQLSLQKQNEKLGKAVQAAHPEAPEKTGQKSEASSEFQRKIQDAFAPQYRTIAKSSELDV